jgi:hypothetical protein
MIASIANFKDPWEKPLRYVPPERLKRLNQEQKEARLLVAAWQGNAGEIERMEKSGKPQPRTDVFGMPQNETKVHLRGKAGRSQTKVITTQFGKTDLFRYGTPMHKAAYRGEVGIVQELLSGIPGPKAVQLLDEKNEVGNTPIHHAAFKGNIGALEAMLNALCDIEVTVNKQLQKLPDSKEKGAKKINASICAINCRNMYLSTPLDKARESHQTATVHLLETWPENLKLRTKATEELKKVVDEYEKRPKELSTAPFRAKMFEWAKLTRPQIKPELMERAKTLLHRAEDLQ